MIVMAQSKTYFKYKIKFKEHFLRCYLERLSGDGDTAPLAGRAKTEIHEKSDRVLQHVVGDLLEVSEHSNEPHDQSLVDHCCLQLSLETELLHTAEDVVPCQRVSSLRLQYDDSQSKSF